MATTTMRIEPDVVVLGSGPAVPVAAIRFLWSLEAREFSVRREGPQLVITPGGRLTDHDKTVIQRYRKDLLAVVSYVEGSVRAPS
ncbi:hypothetical protein BH18ACI5_BH18ACI5_04340 [soil metagenome]